MESRVNPRMRTSHVQTSPNLKQRQSYNLVQPQLFESTSQEKLDAYSPSNLRLHSQHGSQRLRSFYIHSPSQRLCVGTTKPTKFLSETYFEEKLSNLYDISTQIVFPPQFFVRSPQAQKKKEKVIKKLSNCINSRRLVANPNKARQDYNIPTAQIPEVKSFSLQDSFMKSSSAFRISSRKSSMKSIEDSQQSVSMKTHPAHPVGVNYLPDLQAMNHLNHSKFSSNHPTSKEISKELSLTVTSASMYTKPVHDLQSRRFLLK